MNGTAHKRNVLSWIALLWVLITIVVGAPPSTDKKPAKEDPFHKLLDGTYEADESKLPSTLDAKTFSDTINKGTWMVEFYSSYCLHCIEFAGTFNTFYMNNIDDLRARNIGIAKVDCVSSGDLCSANKVLAYPTLQILVDGEYKASFDQAVRNETTMLAFINAHAPDAEASASSIKKTDAVAKENVTTLASPGTLTSSEERLFPAFPASTEVVNSEYPHVSSKLGDSLEIDGTSPNPHGTSTTLDHSAFTRKVTATRDPWIIKFFSPYCPHCIAMKPSWEQMASSMRGKINIGEVNCETDRLLCADMKIQALPSIYYLEGTNLIEYSGLRGYGDLHKFAENMYDAKDATTVNTIKQLDSIVSKTHETSVFLYLYDDATVSEDFEALSRLALATNDIAKFYKTNSTELIKNFKVHRFPALFAVSDTKQYWTEYPNKGPKDMRDHGRLVDWTTDAWLSVVPQMTPINAQKIFNHAEYVVLAVVDPRDEIARETAIREMRATAQIHLSNVERDNRQEIEEKRTKKQLKIDEAKDKDDEDAEDSAKRIRVEVTQKPIVGFAWIDGVFWERWLKGRYGQEDFTKNRIIVNQKASGASRYWDHDSSGHSIEVGRSKIIDTLEGILQGKHQSRMVIEGFRGYFTYLHNSIVNHLWLCGFVSIVVVYYGWNKVSPDALNRKGFVALGSGPLDVGKLD